MIRKYNDWYVNGSYDENKEYFDCKMFIDLALPLSDNKLGLILSGDVVKEDFYLPGKTIELFLVDNKVSDSDNLKGKAVTGRFIDTELVAIKVA